MSKYLFKNLKIENIQDMIEIQNNNVNPIFFTLRCENNFLKSLNEDRNVGLFKENKLIAYSIFSEATNCDKKYLDISFEKRVGKFSGTVINSEYKGKGIQKFFLQSHINFALQNNFSAILSYVHSENLASIKNIEKVGLKYIKSEFIEQKSENRMIYMKTLRGD